MSVPSTSAASLPHSQATHGIFGRWQVRLVNPRHLGRTEGDHCLHAILHLLQRHVSEWFNNNIQRFLRPAQSTWQVCRRPALALPVNNLQAAD